MKICILGFSASGKSSLARALASKYDLQLLHLDTIHFLPGWQTRSHAESLEILNEFLTANANWVIDGNYAKLNLLRRMEEADLIIFMKENRFVCLYRCLKRYFTYRNQSRPSMAEGCLEKIDFEFIKWILYKGRRVSTLSYLKNYPKRSKIMSFGSKANTAYILNMLEEKLGPQLRSGGAQDELVKSGHKNSLSSDPGSAVQEQGV